jgi:hypothetical protein
MGRIVDEGHWIYAAVVVAALSMIFHATVTSVIYNNVRPFTASYRRNPLRQMNSSLRMRKGTTPFCAPHFTYDRYPLPLVGDRGCGSSRLRRQVSSPL